MASVNDPAKILAIVLAGGEGRRLQPLTRSNAKPAVYLGCRHRLVDFVLGNLANSGIDSIYLLAQYRAESLIEYIHTNWTFAPNDEKCFVRVVALPCEPGEHPQGAAAALYQNLELIERHAPDLVAVFAADQVYRMDVRQMVAYHRERNAEISVAAIQMPKGRAASLDAVLVDSAGAVRDLQQGLDIAALFASGKAYASMGNYLFNAEVLVDSLMQMVRRGESDFDRHLLLRLIRSHRVYAYDFSSNKIPGARPYEEAGYWRDIDTLDDYVDALDDISGSQPRFRLNNPYWPVLPMLAAQRPLFDVRHAQLLAARKRRDPDAWSFSVVG